MSRIKGYIEKQCPVCLKIFKTTEIKRHTRGLRSNITLRQYGSYCCSKRCSQVYERVQHNLRGRGFVVKVNRELIKRELLSSLDKVEVKK